MSSKPSLFTSPIDNPKLPCVSIPGNLDAHWSTPKINCFLKQPLLARIESVQSKNWLEAFGLRFSFTISEAGTFTFKSWSCLSPIRAHLVCQTELICMIFLRTAVGSNSWPLGSCEPNDSAIRVAVNWSPLWCNSSSRMLTRKSSQIATGAIVFAINC